MSTEYVNLDRTIQNLKDNQALEEENKETIIRFVDSVAAEGIGDSQQRKYIWSLKTILEKFAPENFLLKGADEQQLRHMLANIHRSDYSNNTKNHMLVSIKRYYKYRNGGRYPDKVHFINTTTARSSSVKREDLFTQQDLRALLAEFRKLRDKAFFITLYESGARPGELAQAKLADVEFNDKGDFIHLEGEKGTPDRTNQLVEAGQYLRKWIEMHPCGGNPHKPDDASAPLWVKTRHKSCRHCEKTRQLHNQTSCSTFVPMEVEGMKYSAFYRAFKRACRRAGLGSRRPYDLRHTRITEVAQFMGYEQLNKFAGWVPGSDRAKTYVHMISDDVNRAIRKQYGLQTSNGDTKEMCKFCGQLNEQDRYECRNCQRPLSLEKQETQKELREAVELYDRLEENGGIEQLRKLEKLIDNANKIEELVGG